MKGHRTYIDARLSLRPGKAVAWPKPGHRTFTVPTVPVEAKERAA